jgi:predicted GH43/DUF377 family glycosyl hydrolase
MTLPPRILPQRLTAEASRVVVRPFQIAQEPRNANPVQFHRMARIIDTVRQMDNRTCQAELALVMADFGDRHREIRSVFLERFDEIASELKLAGEYREGDRLLIGAFFCHEYSFGAAAMMNPSVVPHPDQHQAADGDLRILLSLRAVGEGHISSIAFREGTLHADGTLDLDADSDFAVAAIPVEITADGVTVRPRPNALLSETVIFPVTPAQRNGLEDLRLVRFEEHGNVTYYGTFTAYSGTGISSELFSTTDFRIFDLKRMHGAAAQHKGMALFPRKIDGQYAMLARSDGESLFYLRSDDLLTWNEGVKILDPFYPWELIQIGNCGAPIELDEGWLVLTHGVGAMRKYSIGAALFDKTDPTRLLGRTTNPLLSPSDQDREGYVPNVVYTCGGIVHARTLLMPYGIADTSVGFASINVADVLASLS